MKRTITCWSNNYSIEEFFNDVKRDVATGLYTAKWHLKDYKVKITIERVKETKK